MEIIIKMPPKSVHAYQFIKDAFVNLRVRATLAGDQLSVTVKDVIAAIREQKKFAQKEVANFFEPAKDGECVILERKECDLLTCE